MSRTDPILEKPVDVQAEAEASSLAGDRQKTSAARLTMLGAEPVLRRLWDTPEEDEAWKDL